MITDPKIDSHIGETYGYYTIIGLCEERYKDGHKKYHVVCNDCKQEFDHRLAAITAITSNKCRHPNKPYKVRHCLHCGEEIKRRDNEKLSEYNMRKFCNNSCAASYNNVLKEQKRNYCIMCGKEIRLGGKYCSIMCQHEHRYQEYIRKWKNGEVTGVVGINWKDISGRIRKYIFEKYDYKCAKCGWSEINPFTNTLPLEVEHIDGDATNNNEDNLILLCPNCHSLTATYKGANKGKSTRDRVWLPSSLLDIHARNSAG